MWAASEIVIKVTVWRGKPTKKKIIKLLKPSEIYSSLGICSGVSTNVRCHQQHHLSCRDRNVPSFLKSILSLQWSSSKDYLSIHLFAYGSENSVNKIFNIDVWLVVISSTSTHFYSNTFFVCNVSCLPVPLIDSLKQIEKLIWWQKRCI